MVPEGALPAFEALQAAILNAGPPPCAGDPEAYFDVDPEVVELAQRACRSCRVKSECLDYSLVADERYGVWGGVEATKRRGDSRR